MTSETEEMGERLAQIRTSLAINQSAMAKLIGVERDSWRRYEGGDMPNGKPLARLASMGFSVDWILTGEGSMKSSESPAQQALAPNLGDDFVLLPRYGVKAAAGAGVTVRSEQVVDYVAFRKSYIRDTLRLDSTHLLLIQSVGDSMSPTIKDGDLLLVNRIVEAFRDSAIYCMAIGDDLIVKRVERRINGDVVIKSDNERYSPEVLTADAAASLHVVGQVVWHGGLL